MADDDAPAGQPPVGEPGNVDAVDNSARFAEEGTSESEAAPPATVPAAADVAAASPKAEPGDPRAHDPAVVDPENESAAEAAAEMADNHSLPGEQEAEEAPAGATAAADEVAAPEATPATADEPAPEPEPTSLEDAGDVASSPPMEPALEGRPDATPEAGLDKAVESVESSSTADAPDHTPEENAPAAEADPTPSPGAGPEDAPEPPPARDPDPVRDPLLEILEQELGDALVESDISAGELVVRVAMPAWRRAAEVCRDQLGMDYFCFLSGMDWLHNPNLSAEKIWDPDESVSPLEAPATYETGVAGGDTRFQVLARLYSTRRHVGLTLKADLDEAQPAVETWTQVYRGADWHERETWEMYGFDFVGHPDLRHMYLPTEFEGHPLRKDFPLLAREVKPWPGLVDVEPMPGEDETEGADAAAEGGD